MGGAGVRVPHAPCLACSFLLATPNAHRCTACATACRLRQSVQDQSEQLHAARAKAAEAQLQGDAKALELQHQLQEREQGLAASKAQADALHQEVAQLRCSLQQANSDLQAALVCVCGGGGRHPREASTGGTHGGPPELILHSSACVCMV